MGGMALVTPQPKCISQYPPREDTEVLLPDLLTYQHTTYYAIFSKDAGPSLPWVWYSSTLHIVIGIDMSGRPDPVSCPSYVVYQPIAQEKLVRSRSGSCQKANESAP